jgi:hypothetical protein
MRKVLLAALLGLGFAIAGGGNASAQSWSEANRPGFVGGYGHFGGYYDTFGDYGGRHTYNGYVRTDARNVQTVTLLTVPLQRSKPSKKRLQAKVAGPDCSVLKRKARETGKRKWQARYDACRNLA